MNTHAALNEALALAHRIYGGSGDCGSVAVLRNRELMTESQIQSSFFAVLAINERQFPQLKWIHASMNGASASSKAAAALRKRQGQKKGVWDVCVPVPQTDEVLNFAPGAWIEFKAGKNKLTPEQERFRDHLLSHGYEFAVCRSVDEGLDFVDQYFGIRLKRK